MPCRNWQTTALPFAVTYDFFIILVVQGNMRSESLGNPLRMRP